MALLCHNPVGICKEKKRERELYLTKILKDQPLVSLHRYTNRLAIRYGAVLVINLVKLSCKVKMTKDH